MKKIILIAMGMLLMTILAACGTSNDSSVEATDGNETSNEQTEEDANESESENTSEEKNKMTFEGYVALIQDGQILVTENDLGREIKPDEFNEVSEDAGQMIFFNLEKIDQEQVDSIAIGDHVKIEHGPVGMSFPGKSAAKSLEILDD